MASLSAWHSQVPGGKSALANKADARSKATPSDTIRSERNAI